MLIRLAHRLVAQPMVYDAVQALVGARIVHQRFARFTGLCEAGQTILDVGGGTGLLKAFCPDGCRYVCLDNELPKLNGFRERYFGGYAILGDAVNCPVGSGSIDVVLMTAVAHHLPDEMLRAVLLEVRRALKPGGMLLFLDAVFAPVRLPGRVLWALDRGAHPRRPERLIELIGSYFHIKNVERFAVMHEYLICVAEAKGRGNPDGVSSTALSEWR